MRSSQDLRYSINHFIKNEGQVRMLPYGQAILITQTRLFNVDIKILDCMYDTHGLVPEPTGVGIGNQFIPRLQLQET